MIRIEGVGHAFGEAGNPRRVVALESTTFEVARGELLCLIGPSGCGKSTLLMLVAALLEPSAGSITLNGTRVASPGPDRALVFQDFALLPWRTVLKNVEVGLELKKVPRTEREKIARHYLELVALQGFANHYPHQLSGGMRQRVAIARALCVEPEILLMDEPFGALDAQNRQVMGSELLRLWEDDRKTILFVTHDLDEAIYLADRVIVMSASPGRIIREIPVHLSRPRDLNIRNTLEFLEYRQMIWNLLEQEVRTAGAWGRADPTPATK